MKEIITPYPFEGDERRDIVESTTYHHATTLLLDKKFDKIDRGELDLSFKTYYAFANMLFNEEEELRHNGFKGANLYYHGRQHSVQQATYDAISVTKGILNRNNDLSNHLTPEGIISIVWGAMFHDSGYVSSGVVENYAARTPIHVDESIKVLDSLLNLLQLPSGIDLSKVKRLGKIGIHGTHFPFTPDRLNEGNKFLSNMSTEERKEAQIVRLSVQLADLGGQCARSDYYPTQVKNLKRELNSATPGLGDIIIGSEVEMSEKREVFLASCIKKRPHPIKNVETTAIALLGEEASKNFRDAWFSENTAEEV